MAVGGVWRAGGGRPELDSLGYDCVVRELLTWKVLALAGPQRTRENGVRCMRRGKNPGSLRLSDQGMPARVPLVRNEQGGFVATALLGASRLGHG